MKIELIARQNVLAERTVEVSKCNAQQINIEIKDIFSDPKRIQNYV